MKVLLLLVERLQPARPPGRYAIDASSHNFDPRLGRWDRDHRAALAFEGVPPVDPAAGPVVPHVEAAEGGVPQAAPQCTCKAGQGVCPASP
jgi:hypothetical protein